MPTTLAKPAPNRDRILDYLTGYEMGPDDVVSMWGLLGPDKAAYQVTVFDRPVPVRSQGRRYLVRVDETSGKPFLTRVFQSEETVVRFLATIERGESFKQDPRGVAKRGPKGRKPSAARTPAPRKFIRKGVG